MPHFQRQVQRIYRRVLEKASILADILHVLAGGADHAQPVDFAEKGIGDEVDVSIVRVLRVLQAWEKARTQRLLGQEGRGKFELTGHHVDLNVVRQLLNVVLHLVEHVIDLGVADLVQLVRAVGPLLHLVSVFRLHSLVAAEDDAVDLRAQHLLLVAARVTPEKPLHHLQAELVLGQAEFKPGDKRDELPSWVAQSLAVEKRPLGIISNLSRLQVCLAHIVSIDVVLHVEDAVDICTAQDANDCASDDLGEEVQLRGLVAKSDPAARVLQDAHVVRGAVSNGLASAKRARDVLQNVRLLLHIFEQRANQHCQCVLSDVKYVLDEAGVGREDSLGVVEDPRLQGLQAVIIKCRILDQL